MWIDSRALAQWAGGPGSEPYTLQHAPPPNNKKAPCRYIDVWKRQHSCSGRFHVVFANHKERRICNLLRQAGRIGGITKSFSWDFDSC